MKCVKMFLLASTLAAVCVSTAAHAQNAPAVPVAASVATPATSATPEPVVAVAEPAAPPQWAQDLIVSAGKLPVIGPVVTKGLVYLGIVSSILTAGIAFLLSVLSALSGIASLANLTSFAQKVSAFRDGKIMYWLKYLSMFNAQKPAPATTVASAPTATDAQKAA